MSLRWLHSFLRVAYKMKKSVTRRRSPAARSSGRSSWSFFFFLARVLTSPTNDSFASLPTPRGLKPNDHRRRRTQHATCGGWLCYCCGFICCRDTSENANWSHREIHTLLMLLLATTWKFSGTGSTTNLKFIHRQNSGQRKKNRWKISSGEKVASEMGQYRKKKSLLCW